MQYLEDPQQLCCNNLKCLEQDCEKIHLRILEGVCVGYLLGYCLNTQSCPLQHIEIEYLQQKLESQQINGYYQFNLCKKKCSDNECMYSHPPWIEKICFLCLDFKLQRTCKYENQNLWHMNWLKVKENVYSQYNISDLNPEMFCAKQICGCPATEKNFNNNCIKYYKGICPSNNCNYPHIRWEEIQFNQYSQSKFFLQSCIKYGQEEKKFVKQEQIKRQQQSQNIYYQKDFQQKFIQELEIRPQIDILFVLDCTKSMEKWLEAVKNNINKIAEKFKAKIQIQSSVRFAVVCYKDFQIPNHIVYHDFTVHSQEIEKFLSEQQAFGGDDLPEDLVGALELAYQLRISKHPRSILQMYIITDGPCHGKKYHDLNYDEKMDGDGLEEILEKFQNLKKKRFYLSFIHLSDETLKMEKIIEKHIDNFSRAKLQADSFPDFIEFTLQATMKKAGTIRDEFDSDIFQAKFKKMNSLPQPFNLMNPQAENYIQYIENFINDDNVKVGETQIHIEKNELNNQIKGADSYVIKGFDQRNNQFLIFKIPQFYVRKYRQNEKITDEDIERVKNIALRRFRNQVIAQQLANQFNECCNIQCPDLFKVPLFFPSPIIYILSKPIMNLTYLYAESYIEKPEQLRWFKYSNNVGYYTPKDNLTTFSHFTYEKTNELILINDLQGKLNQLSDPAIQCTLIQNGEKDPTDQGLLGMQIFFQCQHQQCSEICQRIGLNKRLQIQPSSQLTVFAEELQKKQLYLICYNCGQQEELQYPNQMNCQRCLNLENVTKIKKCGCCQQEYQQNYLKEHLRGTVLNICPDCYNYKCTRDNEICTYCNRNVCKKQVKYIQLLDQKIPICIESYRYLRQLACRVCEQKYQMNQLISNEDYSQGFYICSDKCRKQK